MSTNVKYYKIKIIKNLVDQATHLKNQLLDELVINATDPTIVKRRIRMLQHISQYESQLILKIQSFETEDLSDINLDVVCQELETISNRSA
jgi:hypothetical protein